MTTEYVQVRTDDWQALVQAQQVITGCYQEILTLCESDERLRPLMPVFTRVQQEHEQMRAVLARYGKGPA